MKKLKISGVARGQYKQLCPFSWEKCKGSEPLLSYKIRRAVNLGLKTHTYFNGCRIIRYYYLNFLVSDKEIMTIWKDTTREQYHISENKKRLYLDGVTSNGIEVNNRLLSKTLIIPPVASDLTENGFNKNIVINPIQTAQSLEDYGFTNHYAPTLHFSRDLGNGISFNLSVNKIALSIDRLDVLDEVTAQPYDYQRYLLRGNGNEFAKLIYTKVNNILMQLQNHKIITGFSVGMYV